MMTHTQRLTTSLALGVLTCLFSVSASADACNVPVFRYALERWQADPYEVIIFHRGAIEGTDKKIVDHLEKFTGSDKIPTVLTLNTIDLDKNKDEEVQKIYAQQKGAKLPWMMVFYPRVSRIVEPMWTGKLSADVVENLVASPVRKTIATSLLKGKTSVCVLLECGNKKKDDRAAKILESTLKSLPTKLKLPELDRDDPTDTLKTKVEFIPLKIDFSMIRLSRKDPKEQSLIRMLQKSEDDLPNDEPMVFFLYGRGRSLFAFVGAGITTENLERAGAFLCGPCSCEIKRDNPGFDVLISVDWEGGIRGRYVTPSDPPPLTSLLPGRSKKPTEDKKNK